MSSYEQRRLENIRQKEALLKQLQLSFKTPSPEPEQRDSDDRTPNRKRKNEEGSPPTRSSARIAAFPTKPTYNDDEKLKVSKAKAALSKRETRVLPLRHGRSQPPADALSEDPDAINIPNLIESWTSWTSVAEVPTRSASGTFQFPSHPDFLPNKSPEEMLREGCFGGTYFRPLYSRVLDVTVRDDWREIPASWIAGLDVPRFLTSETYRPEVNRFGVNCGLSIEDWEAHGWIQHRFDVRGWFQWYVRFWLGRRCADDDRQVGRWVRCVGKNGRWRKTLLKKYLQQGVRTLNDEGPQDDAREISPVIHQTCHQWALSLTKSMLDDAWRNGM